jgi:RNA polymerase sigma-70 factor (ECF subfamily)
MHTTLAFSRTCGTIEANPADQPSDERLLRGMAAGDKGAMETLYRRHHQRVYRFVLRLLNNAATAEDITSEVFIDVWKQAGGFAGRSEVSTWMLAIARHKAMSALRRRTTDQLDEQATSAIPDDADTAETILQKQQRGAALATALAELSASHREIIDLVYYHGKSIADVAAITGAPPNTVKTRMFYARRRLAEILAANGLDAAA